MPDVVYAVHGHDGQPVKGLGVWLDHDLAAAAAAALANSPAGPAEVRAVPVNG